MYEMKIIKPAETEWAAPICVFPEEDGSLIFCVDY